MNIPELSVIVPVYNTEKYLEKAIDSLLNQTFKDIEVILVNDGSTDASGKICDEFARKDSRVKVIHKQNEGQGVARNLALKKCRGEYITFLDSDDYLESHAYEKVLASTKKYDLDINRFRYVQFSDESEIQISTEYSEPVIYSNRTDIRQAALCVFSRPVMLGEKDLNLGGSACCAIYKRALIVDNNIEFPSNGKYVCEDFIFNFYCLQYAQRVGRSETVFYHYRINPVSTTHKPNLKVVEKSVATCQFLETEFFRYAYPATSISYAQGFAVEILRSYLKNIFMSAMALREKRMWAKEQAELDYFAKVYSEYNWHKMSFKHRLNFLAFYRKHTLLLYILIVGQEKMRELKRKICRCGK